MTKQKPILKDYSQKQKTISDVAAYAGVSIATVSRVLNKSGTVNPSTQSRVRDAVRALGYKQNQIARSLRTNISSIVALVIDDISNPFHGSIAKGIEEELVSAGYFLIICNTEGNLKREYGTLKMLLNEQKVAGIVLSSVGSDPTVLTQLQEDHPSIPWVMVDNCVAGFAADLVSTNNIYGGYLATRYLLDLGHRRIGIITGPKQESSSKQRLEGYTNALEEFSLQPEIQLIRFGDFRRESGRMNTLNLILSPHSPTAIFACNSLMGIGALYAMNELRKRIPEDISLITFDEFDEARLATPGITTVAQDAHELGRKAGKILLKRLQGKGGDEVEAIWLEPKLVVRGSCAGPTIKHGGT